MPDPSLARPDLDPTSRTVDLVAERVSSLERLLTVRLNAIEKAQETFQDTITRVPTEVDNKVGALNELINEKLHTLSEKLAALVIRIADWKLESEKAINAATQARKEAADKSEIDIRKGIDDQRLLLNTRTDSLQKEIASLERRMNMSEGAGSGLRQGWGILVAAIMAAGGLVSIFLILSRRMTP